MKRIQPLFIHGNDIIPTDHRNIENNQSFRVLRFSKAKHPQNKECSNRSELHYV